MLRDAKFVTVWTSGIVLKTPCKVDTNTKEVVFIDMAQIPHGIELGDGIGEYIDLDGVCSSVLVRSDVSDVSDAIQSGYWYA